MVVVCTRLTKLSSFLRWGSFQPMPSTEDLTTKLRSPSTREIKVLIADESKELGSRVFIHGEVPIEYI